VHKHVTIAYLMPTLQQCGELGVGYQGSCWVPTYVPVSWTTQSSSFYRISQVACGANHTLALVMHGGKLVPCAAGVQGCAGLMECGCEGRSALNTVAAGADLIAGEFPHYAYN
jgi:hypothetical protein